MKTLTPAQRLIVSADFKPDSSGRKGVRDRVLALAKSLAGTGVCVKLNSALRALGYNLIDEIHDFGLSVFADLKIKDIEETLSIDGAFLKEAKPELLTTYCSAGVKALQTLKIELPDTEVLGVTVLTNLIESDTQEMYRCSIEEAVLRFARIGAKGKIDGLISSAAFVPLLQSEFGELFSYNSPSIRPIWATIPGDDQNPLLARTPFNAIKAGATRIVVGRPIVRDKNPYDAAMRTIEEIASAFE